MVRVLARKLRIILFDDADRALDREGYNLVYNLLARLTSKVAMIIISDDYNLRGLTERVYTLENGQLIEGHEGYSTGRVRPNQEVIL